MIESENYEAIIIMGRCIGKDTSGKWRNTAYFAKDKINSGVFESFVDPNNDKTFIAGENANTLAGFHFFRKLCLEGKAPSLVIFSAGRPPYLSNVEPELCEGDIMKKVFLRKLASLKNEFIITPEILIFRDNINSRDDMVQSLKTAQERGLKNAAIITVDVHIERSCEFLKLAREQAEITEDEIKMDFISSERILMGVSRKYKRKLALYRETQGYKNTEAMEKHGIEMLKAGTYFNK